ncbi:MAG: hypothetical protein IKG46_00500 [Solobacterium sp.]|nr:hypothetical protein [Solobacterium sp.]
MRPDRYSSNYDREKDREFANEEFGRQAWNEYMKEDEVEEKKEETSPDDGSIRISRKAERDLLEFSNDKLRSKRSRKNTRAAVAAIGASVLLVSTLALVAANRRSHYEYVEPDYEYIVPEEEYYYETGFEKPVFEIDGMQYTLPLDLQELLNQGFKIDRDVYDMLGTDPIEVSLYTEYDTYVGKITLVSPDGESVPIGKSRITSIYVDTPDVWFTVGSSIGVQYSYYQIDDMLMESSAEWTKTGSGSKATYDITKKLEDGTTYHLIIQVDDSLITSISMQIE